MAIPSTTQRLRDNTDPDVNERIYRETEQRLEEIGTSRDRINERIQDLDHEWDIERMLMANASTLALVGTVLGATLNKRFLLIPGVVTGFLLQHALQGWCPPMPLFRRAGVRTANEIEAERAALKAMRGDFQPPAEGRMSGADALAAASR